MKVQKCNSNKQKEIRYVGRYNKKKTEARNGLHLSYMVNTASSDDVVYPTTPNH